MLRSCGSLTSCQLRQAVRAATCGHQVRQLNIWDIFNKEKLAKNREKLSDELRRGYFADLKDLQNDGGKPFAASTELISAGAALELPPLQLRDAAGAATDLAAAVAGQRATLLVVVFRAHAQPMADTWTEAFQGALSSHPEGAGIARLLIVETFALGLPGVRNMIIRGDSRSRPGQALFLFAGPSSTYDLRQRLRITNRLTAHAYLLDAQQRVRWEGSGAASAAEVSSLLQSAERLLQEGTGSRLPGR